MNISEHARIFHQYVGIIPLRDLKFICLAVESCWQEQANGNAGSQDAANRNLHHTIMEALGNALCSDRDGVADTIYRITERDAA